MPRSRKRGSRKTAYRSSSTGELSKRLNHNSFSVIRPGTYFFVKRLREGNQQAGWCYAYNSEAKALNQVLSQTDYKPVDIKDGNDDKTGTAGRYDIQDGNVFDYPDADLAIKDMKNNILPVKYIIFEKESESEQKK